MKVQRTEVEKQAVLSDSISLKDRLGRFLFFESIIILTFVT